MSKTDELRAMREAKYAARQAGAKPVSRAQPAVRPAEAKATRSAKPAAPVAPISETDALCGHRSMNGRSCTRELGHSAKSHRYS